MTIAIWIISFLICFGYIIYTKVKCPELQSISETYYKGFPFFWWSTLTGGTLLPLWLEISGDSYQFLAFLSTCALIFLGTVPRYLTDQKVAHIVCVALLITLSLGWMCMANQMLMMILIIFGLGFSLWFSNIWTMEVVGLTGLYVTLLLTSLGIIL